MCGICGIFTPKRASDSSQIPQSVRYMTNMLARRGPDASGYFEDPEGQFFAGFRRLAILCTCFIS